MTSSYGIIIHKLLKITYSAADKLFSKDQYGYRQGRSTIDAIIALVEEIMDAFENKDVCKVTFCDLSRAFHMVSHDIFYVAFFSLYIDSSLSWNGHTLKLREELSKAIYLIRKLKDEVPEEVMKTAYFGIFQSKMAYGIIVWGAAAEANIIFKLLKKVVRIMASKGPRSKTRGHPEFQHLDETSNYDHFLFPSVQNDIVHFD
ncbi:hypothetical protein O3M35_000350 [Rhynocoris fuscipes]|uniref:Reverse transcriptase domain-containing protein n=1 Tax=Rhynocoris fuscipes TaxID=488301 RepID=A0AAW1DMA1_9HEMI